MTGAGVEDNVSSESDTDDWDSIGSDEPMADCVSLYSTWFVWTNNLTGLYISPSCDKEITYNLAFRYDVFSVLK